MKLMTILLVLMSALQVEKPANGKFGGWVYGESKSAEYREVWRRGSCSVAVLRDGKGVDLAATSTGNGYEFYTNIMVRADTLSVKNDAHTSAGWAAIDPEKNVFVEMCLESAQNLPPEVLRMFFGYGGIKVKE